MVTSLEGQLRSARSFWFALSAGFVITAGAALSVHVVLQDVLGVPYPQNLSVMGRLEHFDDFASVAAVLLVYRTIADRLPVSLLIRWFVLFLLIAMLDEDLIRGPLMNCLVSSAWAFSFVRNLPSLAENLTISGLVVLAVALLPRLWQLVLATLIIAALMNALIEPWLQQQGAMILNSITRPDPDGMIMPPYGPKILIPAYVTFAEPVLACFVIVALMWRKLPGGLFHRLCSLTVLVVAMRGLLFAPFTYMAKADMPSSMALLSVGQFSLQAATMAALTVLTWQFSLAQVDTSSARAG